MATSQYAAIELGGTKCICLVGKDIKNISSRLEVATREPEPTLSEIARYLEANKPFKSLGIGTFGPVDLNKHSETYGCIQQTPKKGWSGFNLLSFFKSKLKCPVFIDTDVSAAAIGEYNLGAAKNLTNFVYVTVGTGIGASVLINGVPVQGMSHPEMGHVSLPRVKGDELFAGCCTYHKECAEGLASGSAIFKRWGTSLDKLPFDSAAWQMQAQYLADFCHNLTLLYSPQRIIMGGGVSSEVLLEKIRPILLQRLNGYVAALTSEAAIKSYLTLPILKNDAGPFGAFLLNAS